MSKGKCGSQASEGLTEENTFRAACGELPDALQVPGLAARVNGWACSDIISKGGTALATHAPCLRLYAWQSWQAWASLAGV